MDTALHKSLITIGDAVLLRFPVINVSASLKYDVFLIRIPIVKMCYFFILFSNYLTLLGVVLIHFSFFHFNCLMPSRSFDEIMAIMLSNFEILRLFLD